MPFLTDLIVTPRARKLWELRQDLIFLDAKGKKHTAKKGFMCDLASIPAILEGFMTPASLGDFVYAPAAVIHDWTLAQEDIPSRVAHKLFKECLYACEGADETIINIMCAAVNHPKASEQDYNESETTKQNSTLGD